MIIMIADKSDGKDWKGNDAGVNADQNPHGGMANETKGREAAPDLYKTDVLGKVIKRKKNDIWSRGNEVRVKHKEDE